MQENNATSDGRGTDRAVQSDADEDREALGAVVGASDAHAASDLGGHGERVELENVRKEFEGLTAVDGIDLTVEPGELLVLLGPSGCGKTTTLRMIAGLETVSSGTIRIGSEDVTETLPQRRDVSMVFQNYALYPHKTVRENLRFPLGKTDLDGDEARARVDDVAELLEISGHLDKDPDQLSGGQRQRVALGRTIIREPRVFLMDEPLSNLDAKLRVQTRAQIRDLQTRLGTTTVYVTHDQEEALSIADRLVIMHDGHIEQIGSPEDIYNQPNNEFVATFMGEPAMNLLGLEGGHGDRLLFPEAPTSLSTLGIEVPDRAARIGVRPEDVYVGTAGTEPTYASDVGQLTSPFEMTVEVVEPLGHGYETTLVRGDVTLAVRTRELAASPGDTVEVAFDTDRLLYFDDAGVTL
ncbi:MAG: ABC transporter ATP-binding protein [Halobacteriaceae archaeon]